MADAMLLNPSERHWLGRLPVGVALIKLMNRWHAPFFIKIPHVQIQRGTVTDEAIAKQTGTIFAKKSLKLPQPPKHRAISPLSPKDSKDERDFLKDVKKHPHSTMTKRYQRLRLNPRKGVKIKNQLLTKELIQEVTVATAKGRVKLLTELGNAETAKPKPIGNPSIEHQYWVENIQQNLKKWGYAVFSEHPLKTGGTVDILAIKGKLMLAVEVETGKSDILANLLKCVNIHEIVVLKCY